MLCQESRHLRLKCPFSSSPFFSLEVDFGLWLNEKNPKKSDIFEEKEKKRAASIPSEDYWSHFPLSLGRSPASPHTPELQYSRLPTRS